jgi:hypothetical protein
MSIFFDTNKQIREKQRTIEREIEKRKRLIEERDSQRERDVDEINNILIPKIKTKLKELFPKMDMEFFLKLNNEEIKEVYDEFTNDKYYFVIKYDELNYNQFISYKIDLNMSLVDLESGENIVISAYQKFLDSLDKIDPNIFMSNVNIDWKLLQLAKKNTSIHIPPSPPNAPPLPSPPKRSSPKKSKSKITNETLQEAKRKLKPKAPPNPPPLPKSVTRVRKPLQSPIKSTSNNSPKFLDGKRAESDKQTQSPPKRSSPKSKSNITSETLEMAKSKLKPKGPPNPPPLPSPPKRSSPKKSKSKLTSETLQEAKSKLKHSQKKIKPDDPDYDLEMAFKNLEK